MAAKAMGDPLIAPTGLLPPAIISPGTTYFHPLFGHSNAGGLGLLRRWEASLLYQRAAGEGAPWWAGAATPAGGGAAENFAPGAQMFRTPLCAMELPVHSSSLM